MMLKFTRIGAAALALAFLMIGSANAACIHFEENQSGDAYLINSCSLPMNAAYGVTSGGEWTPGSGSTLARVPVGSSSRKLLWSRGSAPVAGRYQVKVFSCVAPTSLVYPTGGRPTCQLDTADAG
jgi:hypothetical protein